MTKPITEPLCPNDDSPLTPCKEDTGLTKLGHYWCDTHYHWVSFAAAHDLHPNIMDFLDE